MSIASILHEQLKAKIKDTNDWVEGHPHANLREQVTFFLAGESKAQHQPKGN